MGKGISLGILFSFIFSVNHAQEISPYGKFLKDSVMVGEEVQYSLSVKYPLDWHVIFPDSTYNYEPFEFYTKSYFPTRIDSTHAYDSAVYTLSTFEIDLVQKLQLPIYLLNGNDSTTILASPDSVFLRELVTVLPDSLKFRENLAFQAVNYAFNYPYFMIGLGLVALIGLGTFFIFGNSIRTKIKLYRMRKAYEKFSLEFDRGIIKIKQSETNAQLIEEILVIWKSYMEKIEDRPFTKYTSKEILKVGFEEQLKNVLQTIDRSIYGAIGDEEMHKNFEALEDFTFERYKIACNQAKSSQNEPQIKASRNEEKEIQSTAITQFGLDTNELYEELKKGGRFVIYYYTISILIMTFRRSSKVKFIRSGENGIKQGLVYSLISFLLGWWGIPWGLIYTPRSLYINFRGGKNVTDQLINKVTN